jgi:hypothetical protein
MYSCGRKAIEEFNGGLLGEEFGRREGEGEGEDERL